jgi:hypothetical protein
VNVYVAATVGFESHSAFTRAFTAYTGQTPTAYRHRVTSNELAERRRQAEPQTLAFLCRGPWQLGEHPSSDRTAECTILLAVPPCRDFVTRLPVRL